MVRADTGSVPAVMHDVPVAAEDAAGDKGDTRSAEVACHIHVGPGYCSGSIHSQCQQEAGQGQWDQRLHAHWHCQRMTEVVAGRCHSRHLPEVPAAGTDMMVCETYSPVRLWPVAEEAVEVEEAGTAARTRADSCCSLKSGVPAQAAEAEVHTEHILRAYRIAHNNHRRRARRPEHSAVAEGVDMDRMP